MKIKLISLALAALSIPLAQGTQQKICDYSPKYGNHGEKWKAEDRIPDFSYAGYHAGEMPIPRESNATWNLKRNFGAVGDGKTDDTNALKQALQGNGKGILFIPAGTYLISDKISFGRGNFVIRGEGPGKTVLMFSKSLTDLFGNTPDAHGYSQYSFGPGLFNVNGRDLITSSNLLAEIVAPAKRGDKTIKVSTAAKFEIGQWIRVVESDSGGSLIRYMYSDKGAPAPALTGSKNIVRFLSRVESICQDRGGITVTLERPLPYDIRPEWRPEVHGFGPTNEEFGIEGVSFQFPWSAYPDISKRPVTTLYFSIGWPIAGCGTWSSSMPTSAFI